MSKILKKYIDAYANQKVSAKLRGIEFLLTFEEWYKIWLDSGKLLERGRKKTQYCMARYGDIGPYSADNVKIILFSENRREALLGKSISAEHRQKLIESNLGRCPSKEARKKMSIASKGKPKSTEHRKNISKSKMGHAVSDETKRKQSEAKRGKSKSELHKKRLSDASKLSWQKRKQAA